MSRIENAGALAYPSACIPAENASLSGAYACGGSRVITVPESTSVPAVEKTDAAMGSSRPPTLMPANAT